MHATPESVTRTLSTSMPEGLPSFCLSVATAAAVSSELSAGGVSAASAAVIGSRVTEQAIKSFRVFMWFSPGPRKSPHSRRGHTRFSAVHVGRQRRSREDLLSEEVMNYGERETPG